MSFLAILHACWPAPAPAPAAAPPAPQCPLGLLASRAFWLGGLASAALWALALDIAFG